MVRKIFTENPEDDLWQELLRYSYKANVKRYLDEHSLPYNDGVINCIIGSVLQAHEYYSAGKNVNLQISPLLLYYGTTNLLFGIGTLISGTIPNIQKHGMKPNSSTIQNYIADTSVTFPDPKCGGIHQFTKWFGYTEDLAKLGSWQLIDFLSSIAEINDDYQRCYSEKYGNILMLDIFQTPTGQVERIYCPKEDVSTILSKLENVEGFNKSYLRPQTGHDFSQTPDYLILRPKVFSKNIKKISFSGQPYLQVGIEKNGKRVTIPTLFNMYISLFIMSSLCRYHPEKWGPFVVNDETGERLLFEKLMYYARRMIPNMVLNRIYDQNIVYVTQQYAEKEMVKHVGEHEVKELIKKELYVQDSQRRHN